jgi:hypothetical protein
MNGGDNSSRGLPPSLPPAVFPFHSPPAYVPEPRILLVSEVYAGPVFTLASAWGSTVDFNVLLFVYTLLMTR